MDNSKYISSPNLSEENFVQEALRITRDLYKGIERGYSSYAKADAEKSIKRLSEKWSKTKEVKYGYKPNSFYIDHVYNSRFLYTLNHFHGTDFRYPRKGVPFLRAEFRVDLFAKMISVQAAYHLAKFGEIKFYELMLASVIILFRFFNIMKEREDGIEGYIWCISSEDIQNTIRALSRIIDNDPKFGSYVRKSLPLPGEQPKETISKKKPVCGHDYMMLYEDGMKVKDWVSVIMKQWGQSRRTVYNNFDKFGIDPKEVAKQGKERSKDEIIQSLMAELEAVRKSKN